MPILYIYFFTTQRSNTMDESYYVSLVRELAYA